MIAELSTSQFYQDYLMARQLIDPTEFGIDLSNEDFKDRMVDALADFTRGAMTIDEILLRPRTALQFCDMVRQHNSWYDLPDDIILRAILTRRKSPV